MPHKYTYLPLKSKQVNKFLSILIIIEKSEIMEIIQNVSKITYCALTLLHFHLALQNIWSSKRQKKVKEIKFRI